MPISNAGGSLNWGMYTGTMQDQVQKALADRNGPMAADLAAKLWDCFVHGMQLEYASSNGGDSGGDPAVQAVRKEQLQEYQRQVSACQAISGDHRQVRLQLLNVAVEQKVVGAANASFQSGVRTPDVLKMLVRDSTQGDLYSMVQVALNNAALLGIDIQAQSAVRYALKIASTDTSVGARIGPFVELSEKIAPVWDTENLSTYDYSKMNDAARKEGAEIANRLVKQLTKPKQ